MIKYVLRFSLIHTFKEWMRPIWYKIFIFSMKRESLLKANLGVAPSWQIVLLIVLEMQTLPTLQELNTGMFKGIFSRNQFLKMNFIGLQAEFTQHYTKLICCPQNFLPFLFPLMFQSKYISLCVLSLPRSNLVTVWHSNFNL